MVGVICAEVAEQADAHDSKSCGVTRVGSTPTFGTQNETDAHLSASHWVHDPQRWTCTAAVQTKRLRSPSSIAFVHPPAFLHQHPERL